MKIDGIDMISISKASKALGVSIHMIKTWEKQGILMPDFRTTRGDRYYLIQNLLDFNPLKKDGLEKYL